MLYKHHGSLDSQLIKDWFLFIVVLVVVAVDLLIFVTGTAIPSSRFNATILPDAQTSNGLNLNISIFILIKIEFADTFLYIFFRMMGSPLDP